MTFRIFLAALTLAPLAFAQDEAGFVSIFNGKDLTDWDGVPSAWKVEDGAIVCAGQLKGGKNWLIWEGGEPADFELRLEFKFTSGNSGVQIRSHMMGDTPYHVQGYQVEIAKHDVMGLWHHSLAPEKHRSHLALAGEHTTYAADGTKTVKSIGDGEALKKLCKDGEWNKLVIIAKGSTVTQKINGKTFSILTDLEEKYTMTKGLIALQDHGKGCVAAFRKIRLKPLD
ncbi:MAG: 3-keto-disaccharide hydrolase [Verrucomicrobiales bacterium]